MSLKIESAEPRFPQELFDQLIDISSKETKVLAQYSLVSWAWCSRTRLHLFRSVTLDTRRSIQPPHFCGWSPTSVFLQILKPGPMSTFAAHVLELDYYNPHYQFLRTGHDWDALLPQISPLQYLQTLRLNRVRLDLTTGLMSSATFSKVVELALIGVTFDNRASGAQILGSFPALRVLGLHYLSFENEEAEHNVVPLLAQCASLHKVTLSRAELCTLFPSCAPLPPILDLGVRDIQTSDEVRTLNALLDSLPELERLSLHFAAAFSGCDNDTDLTLASLCHLSSLQFRWERGNPFIHALPRWLSTIRIHATTVAPTLRLLDFQCGDIYGFQHKDSASMSCDDHWAALESVLDRQPFGCLAKIRVMVFAGYSSSGGVLERLEGWQKKGVLSVVNRN